MDKDIIQFISDSIYFQNYLQYNHWNAKRYGYHIATEKTYGDWQTALDSFVESILGNKLVNRKNLHLMNPPTNENILEYMLSNIQKIRKLVDSSIQNILDEMQTILYRFMYLSDLK
jgi:hypothetical protein